MTQHIVSFIVLALLLLMSATYSAAETALFSLSRLRLQQLRNEPGKLAQRITMLLHDPRKLLVLILFSNMFVNIAYFALATIVAKALWQETGKLIPALFFEFVAICAIIVFAEITPKAIAIHRPMSVAKITVPILIVSGKVLGPLQNLLNLLVHRISHIFLPTSSEQFINDDELRQLMNISETAGIIKANERKLFTAVVNFKSLRVKDIMRPRTDFVMLKRGENCDEAVNVAEDKHQRIIPIFDNTIDDVSAIVYVRDLLIYPEKDVEELRQAVFFIPELKFVDSLLNEFVSTKSRFAVAVNEYGGVAGFISIEDIISELFGNVDAEGKQLEPFKRIEKFAYILHGRLPLRDLNERLNLNLSGKGISTVGGFISLLLDSSPEQDQTVVHERLKFTVIKALKHRIETVRLDILEAESPEDPN